MTEIAVILPAYNEALTIEGTIVSFHEALPRSRIVVVDNNSSDDTAELARAVFNKLGIGGQVISEPRQGKGNAIRRAFREVDADVYVMADADQTYPANRAKDLIAPVLNGSADMVVGDRIIGGDYGRENKRRFHAFGNNLVRWLINLLFSSDLTDIMSGYRAFSKRLVKNYPILVEGFEIETDLTLHALDKRFAIASVPIEYKDRPEGSQSKLNTISDGAKVIFTIASILRYYRPLLFFGTIAVVFACLGLLAGAPVLNDWIQHQYIYHVPLAVLAAALEIVAVITMSVGLILDSITHQHRMNFESQLIKFGSDRP